MVATLTMVNGHLLQHSRVSGRVGEAAWYTRMKMMGHFDRDMQTSSPPAYAMLSTEALEATLPAQAHPNWS